jgi:hypothetical protein
MLPSNSRSSRSLSFPFTIALFLALTRLASLSSSFGFNIPRSLSLPPAFLPARPMPSLSYILRRTPLIFDIPAPTMPIPISLAISLLNRRCSRRLLRLRPLFFPLPAPPLHSITISTLLLALTPASPLSAFPSPPLVVVTRIPLASIMRIVALLAAESVFPTCLARTRHGAFVVFIVATADILAFAISSALPLALACPVSFSLAPTVAVPAARLTRHASYLVRGV